MNREIWERCVAFHGHECGGLTIGYKASLYALHLLGLDAKENLCMSSDEELVCISENDACGVDAIQVILGCSVGKGNLLFHLRGKQAFSFYRRNTGQSVRLVLKPTPEGMKKSELFSYYQSCTPEEMFDVKKVLINLPEKARIFQSVICSCCGESTAENMIRIQGDDLLCLDCYKSYDRFHV